MSNLSVSPTTLTFSATDPDSGVVTSTPVVVQWNALLSLILGTWSLSVQADQTTFTSCSTVPVSAVTVTCDSAVATGLLPGTGHCNAPFALSTSPQIIASGLEGTVVGNFTVQFRYTLTDSWRYKAAISPACTLSLTYNAVTP